MLEIDATRAETVLTLLLGRSFVYDDECIAAARARELAAAFVAYSGGSTATFYTNAAWDDKAASYSWTPLTDSVFDGGVIAIGSSIAACVWIEEDD